MKFVIAFIGLFSVAYASTIILPATTTLVRSPSDDSAIVQSSRIGGSFAYSTLEGHAYKAITPVVHNVVTQYTAGLPLVYTAAGPQLVYHQPLYTNSLLVPGATIVGAAPELPKLEGRSEEPKPEEKKEDDDSVVVDAA